MVGADKDIYKAPPNRIREFRLSYGLTLEDLADKVGISKSMLSYIEKGEKLPNVVVAMDIAEIFNTTVEVLWRRKRNG